MEKNIIQQRLGLVENLLNEVNSKEEFLWLQGARDELQFLKYSIEMKGGVKL